MSDLLQTLLIWMTAHPALTALFIFLTAFFESLILVGILLPGALIMFGLGALVTTGHVTLSHLLVFGSLGAIAGDCLSFVIGRHYQKHLLEMWPFNRYPALTEKGTEFIQNHGGKGVFMARFIGPIRPVVPAVAGMLNMPSGRFFSIAIIAGFLWTPAYVLPGAAFGASLNLASEVAMRLVIFLMAGIIGIWFLQWLCRKSVVFAHKYSRQIREIFLRWENNHKYLGNPVGAIVDPDHPEIKGILTLALLLFIISWSLLFILTTYIDTTELIRISEQIHRLLQQIKTPATDYLMLLISELSSPFVHFSIFTCIAIWLAWHRLWQSFAHWVAAISFGLLLTASLRWLVATEYMDVSLSSITISPPTSQITDMISILGFFAILVAHKMQLNHRWIPYSIAAAWVSSAIISRLYLGTVGLLGITGGVAFGMAWLILIGTAYRTHIQQPIPVKGIVTLFICSWVIAGTWNLQLNWKNSLVTLDTIRQYSTMPYPSWKNNGWASLPDERIDLAHKKDEPLTLQWTGNIGTIRELLLQQGWKRPKELTLTSTLFWLSSNSPNVPLPPRAHDGRYEALILTKPYQGQQLVLRLWPTLNRIQYKNVLKPLWLGTLGTYQITHPLPILSIPETLPFDGDILHALALPSTVKITRYPNSTSHKRKTLLLESP